MAREGKLFGANILLDRCGADEALIALAKHCLEVDPYSRPGNAEVLAGLVTECLEGLQDRTRQIENTRLQAEAQVAEAEARELLAQRARRLAFMLAVAGVIVAAMLAAGLGWYANDRSSRATEELSRRTVAIHQINEAIHEAETLDGQARTDQGTWLARDSAAQQASAACQRAEVLVAATSSIPDELRDRLDTVKTQVALTKRATHLAIDLEQWHASLFLSGGSFDPLAAKRCRDLFALHGIDILDGEPSYVAAELNSRLAARLIREALVDWLAVSPEAPERKKIAAIFREENGSSDQSLVAALESNDPVALSKLADTPPDDSLPAVGLAVAARRLIDAGQSGDAQRLLNRGVGRYPADFAINAQLGILLCADSKRRTDALRYLTAARTARPNDAIVNLQLGRLLFEAGRGDEAEPILRSAIEGNPKLETAHVQLGRLLEARGDMEGARSSFAAAVAINPANVAAQIGLGQSELARGDENAAERAFRAANTDKPNAAACAGLGAIHLKRWEASKAVAAYLTASELQPTNVDYRLGLIKALRMGNDPSGAIREARAAARAIPSAAAIHRMLAELLRMSGDKPAAIGAYIAAAKCDPKDVDTRLQLGAVYESLDDIGGAQEAYHAAALLRPDDATIKAALARVEAKVNQVPTTVDACRRLLVWQPANVAVRHQLGRLLADRGDATAIDELKKAVDDRHATDEMRIDLAETLLKYGRFREAAGAFRDAAARFPETSAKQSAALTAARNALRWAGLEARLPEALTGAITPSTPAMWADFGQVCRHTHRFAGAAKFFAAAAAGDEQYARVAAMYAALAGFNLGSDSKELTGAKRADLRKSALLAFRSHRSWTTDPSLASIKGAPLKELTPEERVAWQSLWANEQTER